MFALLSLNLSNCLAVCTHTLFWSSVNICHINLAEIFHSFKICFKMKCIRNKLYTNSFGNIMNHISAITFNYFSDFGGICLACYSLRSTRFCCIFDRLYASQIFLFFLCLQTVLTLSQTKYFGLFQTESVCRRQFQIE